MSLQSPEKTGSPGTSIMVLTIFNQPFPINTWRRYWMRGAGFGLFVFFFLLIFQPFRPDLYPPSTLLFTSAVYGATTGVIIFSGSFVLVKIIARCIEEETWTLGKQILWNIFLMICITFANVLVTQWMHQIRIPLSFYFTMLQWVFSLGVLPVVIAELLTYNHFLRKYERAAAQSPHHLHPGIIQKNEADPGCLPDPEIVLLHGENLGEVLEIRASELVAVQSLDNYVNIYWESSGNLQTTLLRNTLSDIASQLTCISHFYRCHRSWLVNMNRVQQVQGNAQGLRLSLKLLHHKVPVSRANINGFRELRQSGGRLLSTAGNGSVPLSV